MGRGIRGSRRGESGDKRRDRCVRRNFMPFSYHLSAIWDCTADISAPHNPPRSGRPRARNGDHVHFMEIRARPRASVGGGGGGGGVPSLLPPSLPLQQCGSPSSPLASAAVLLPVWHDDAAELRAHVAPLRRAASTGVSLIVVPALQH